MDSEKTITYSKILIINLGGIGDVLLSTPALRALKNNFPKAKISVLVVPRVCEIVKDLSYIDNVFILSVGYKVSFASLIKNLYILLALRKRHFDLVINMRTLVSKTSAKKIKFLLDVINPKNKAGRDTEGRGYFFDIKIPETQLGQKYEMECDIDTVKALGVDVSNKTIDFDIDKESMRRVAKILGEEGIGSGDVLIGIHPGGMPSRCWPIENFSQVIAEICKETPCRFVITGGKDEIGLVKKLTKMPHSAKVINVAGKLNIKELGALIKRCNLFISNDTGPMHIAAILRTPLVAIFGPGYITRFDPRNISEKVIVLYKAAECAPCDREECDDLKCLREIAPNEVTEAVLVLLEQ